MKALILFTLCLSAFAGNFECEKELNHLSKDLFKNLYSEKDYSSALKKVNRCVSKKCVLSKKEKEQVQSLITKTYGAIFRASVNYYRLGNGLVQASEMERDAYRDDALELRDDETVKVIAKIKDMHAKSKASGRVVGGDRDSGKDITEESKKSLSNGRASKVRNN